MTNLTSRINPLLTIGLILALSLLIVTQVKAIQNIGFPDDSRGSIITSDFAKFKSAQMAMHNALTTLIKLSKTKGQTKEKKTALRAINTQAGIIQTIATKADIKSIASFMADVKSWSISADADGAIDLAKKIDASLIGLKVKPK